MIVDTHKIAFERLTPSDYARVGHVEVAPEQVAYSGTVDMAFASPELGVTLYAITRDRRPVGFFKIDVKFPETYDFAREGDLGLRAFMIDKRQQGRGIGTAAVSAMPAYLVGLYPEARALVLTVNIRNTGAIRSYIKAGFQDTGDIYTGGLAGPQHVMRIPLHRKTDTMDAHCRAAETIED